MPASLVVEVLVQGILTGLVYGLMALGLSVIFGVSRTVNFAHGEFTVVAMYAAWLLFARWRLDPLLVAAPLAAAFFALGYIVQRVLVAPFVRRPEHQQFIYLIGLAIVIVNGLLIVFGPDSRHVDASYSFASWRVGPILVDQARAYAAAGALVMCAGLFAFFRYTMTGTAIRACADNPTGAEVVGLDVKRLNALAFGLGLACAGAAGALMIALTDASPNLGPAFTLLAFVIVIIGGLGSMPGALLGGLLIGVSEALTSLFASPSLKSMFSFVLLALVLTVRPQGLLGRRT